MNRLIPSTPIIVLCLLCTTGIQAQTADLNSTFDKTSAHKFYEAGELNNLKGDFVAFGLPDLRQMSTLSRGTTKRLKVLEKVKGCSGPIAIRNKDKCLKISSPRGQAGTIVWWDRNRDGRIQPLTELRCLSPSGKGLNVYVEEISCK
ncbi:MAG: hypothetical protein AAFP02_14100 [Bacteroidota bacterium]